MMQGSKNEHVALSALGSYIWVRALYSFGMLADEDNTWCSCSPGGIATVDHDRLPVDSVDDNVAWGTYDSIHEGGGD